jgi:DNA-binding transcriptional MerR regulator
MSIKDDAAPPLTYFQSTAAAARAGVSTATLRAYEADGLIKPLRTATGLRLFTQADIDRVKQIYRARQERHGRTGVRREQP